MKRIIMMVAAFLALAGCNTARHGAEKAVRQKLTDPDSAKFGEFFYNSKTKRACLTINAKNSMGGYTGDQQALLARDGNGWRYVDVNGGSMPYCKMLWAEDFIK